jgi:hypothetical protein
MNRDAKTSSTGLVCTNDGFVKMIAEGTDVLLGPLSIVKELAIGMVPDNFKRAINYGWAGTTGLANWMGYGMASTFHLAEELGFG